MRCLIPLLILFLASPAMVTAGSYGEPVPEGEAQRLSEALAAEPDGQRRLYSGRIVEVCQNKGCWAMLEDDGQGARLMMHKHAFSIPMDYQGRSVVWGELKRVEMSEEMAQHLAEDAGRSEPVARVEYRIDTFGLNLLDE